MAGRGPADGRRHRPTPADPGGVDHQRPGHALRGGGPHRRAPRERVLLTYEGDGHTVVGNGVPCVDDIAVAYLVDLEVPEDGTTC